LDVKDGIGARLAPCPFLECSLSDLAVPMKCAVCGSRHESVIRDLPFKVGDRSTVILNGLPGLQCEGRPKGLIEGSAMERIEEILSRVDAEAELQIIAYGALFWGLERVEAFMQALLVNNRMDVLNSRGAVPHPLPYQGSKRSLAAGILRYFPIRFRSLYEPFAGSAAVTIAAAVNGLGARYHINDLNRPLMELWRAII
jgi:hypothetical protein